MPNIMITGSDPKTGKLTMSDHGHTEAKRGEVVSWIIRHGSGLKSIDSINTKPGSTNVFEARPSKEDGSTTWHGKVSSTIAVPVEEDYAIGWSDMQGKPHVFDPKISVNT